VEVIGDSLPSTSGQLRPKRWPDQIISYGAASFPGGNFREL
jgi:hypothetical protein